MKRFTLKTVLVAALLGIGSALGAQSLLGLDGGLEGTATIDNSAVYTTGQVGKWTKQHANQTLTLETSVTRSGGKSLKLNNSSSIGYRAYTPQITVPAGARLVVQYYRRAASTTDGQETQVRISRDGTSSSEASVSGYATVTAPDTWEKVTYVPTATDWVASTYGIIAHRSLGTGGDIYIDDVAIYVATGVDNTPPAPASAPAVGNETAISLDLSWTASPDTDGGGYLVLRGTAAPNTAPNVNGIYAAGNTIGNATVAYQGTATSFTDNGLAAGTVYYYAVYTYDKAYNYSAAVSTSGITTGATSPILSVSPESLNFGSRAVGGSASAPQSISILVSGLTDDVEYELNNTADFNIDDSGFNPTTGGVLAVTFNPSASGTRTGAIIISSVGATSKTVLLTGIGDATAQTLVAWQFSNPASVGNEATYNATTNHSNLNQSVLSRGAGLTYGSSFARSFYAGGWENGSDQAGAITADEYFEFAVDVKPGFKVSLSTLDVKLRRSGDAAPNQYIWQYKIGGSGSFTDIGSAVSFNGTTGDGDIQAPIDLSGITALQDATETIYFRLYAWGASTTGTTFSIGRYAAGNTTNSLAIGGVVEAIQTPVLTSLKVKWWDASIDQIAKTITVSINSTTPLFGSLSYVETYFTTLDDATTVTIGGISASSGDGINYSPSGSGLSNIPIVLTNAAGSTTYYLTITDSIGTGLDEPTAGEPVLTRYYTLTGIAVSETATGILIKQTFYDNGKVNVEKILKK